MARSKRQKAKAKAARVAIRTKAKSSGKTVSRSQVQAARQTQKATPRPAPKSNSGSRSSSSSASRSSGGGNTGTTMRNPGNSGRVSSSSVRNAGSSVNSNSSSSNNRQGKQTVAQRRQAAATAGVSLSDYKKGLAAGHYNNRGRLTTAGKENRASTGGYKPKGSSNSGNGQYGIRSGPADDETRAMNEANGAVLRDSGYAKLEHDQDFTMQDYLDGHTAKHNENSGLYTLGDERMSSEGLYQDRYNVGYHGEDDQGSIYASNRDKGSIKDHFKKFTSGEESFFNSYRQWAGLDRQDGYAGDVLKLIDSGYMKVNDDQYNMIVTDAKNYDWDKRAEIAGRDAHGGGTYDSRVGGVSGNHVSAMNDWYDRQDAQGHQQQTQQYQQNQYNESYQEPNSANPNLGNVEGGRTSTTANWMTNPFEQKSFVFDPYANMGGSNNQSAQKPSTATFDKREANQKNQYNPMGFNFNPYAFNQGQ